MRHITGSWPGFYKSKDGQVRESQRGFEEGSYTYLKDIKRFIRTEDLFDSESEAQAAEPALFRDTQEWIAN
ncbi:MAG: hypothetical protein ACRD2L_03865 [Terriglobia bacterium]